MSNCYLVESEKERPESSRKAKVVMMFKPFTLYREFTGMDEVERLSELLGFRYFPIRAFKTPELGNCIEYGISHIIADEGNNTFKSLREIPAEARKMTLTEGGITVTGYFINDGKVITVFRPNCDAEEVFWLY